MLIFRRRWRILLAIWAATVVFGSIYTFTSKRLYRPQATLEIRPETPLVAMEAGDQALLASRMMWENYYRTQEAIITSPRLMEEVLKALPDAVRRWYQVFPEPAKVLGKQVDIEKVRTTFVLKVGVIDEDPEKATQVVNTLIAVYLEDMDRRARELKSGAMELLSKEALPTIRKRVDDANETLRQFQLQAGFIDFEEHYKSLVESRRRVDGRLTDLCLSRARISSQLEALSGYGSDSLAGAFNPAFHATRSLELLTDRRAALAAELASLRKSLKEKHPEVQRLEEELRSVDAGMKESIQGTLQALQTDLQAVKEEEKALLVEQSHIDEKLFVSGQKLTQYRKLETELEVSKDLYNSYLKKQGETTATSGSGLAGVRVLDYATKPTRPFAPHIGSNLMVAMVLGLMLGVAGVYVTEYLDDRIASPEEVEAFMGLDVLAVIHKLDKREDGETGPVMLGGESSLSEFESFRSLRTEVVTRLEHVSGCRIVAVLSPLKSEGKSTVTANLAKALSMEGWKILVLDADMRRPTMMKTLAVNPEEMVGLERVLGGEVSLEDAVRPSRLPGVDVIGALRGTTGAAELVASSRFEATLQSARSRYDYVIVDTAPVNQVAETLLVARRADGALLVLREGQTGRNAARMAVKRLTGMGVKLLGGVLNCGFQHGSGYGYYYGYGYGYGYGTENKEEGPVQGA